MRDKVTRQCQQTTTFEEREKPGADVADDRHQRACFDWPGVDFPVSLVPERFAHFPPSSGADSVRFRGHFGR